MSDPIVLRPGFPQGVTKYFATKAAITYNGLAPHVLLGCGISTYELLEEHMRYIHQHKRKGGELAMERLRSLQSLHYKEGRNRQDYFPSIGGAICSKKATYKSGAKSSDIRPCCHFSVIISPKREIVC